MGVQGSFSKPMVSVFLSYFIHVHTCQVEPYYILKAWPYPKGA